MIRPIHVSDLEKALSKLRDRTRRSIPFATLACVLALLYAWQASRHGLTATIEGKSVILIDGVLDAGLAVLWTIVAASRLWTSPTDRLVMLLAEEHLKQKKAAEPGATDNPDDAQRLREDH